MIKFLNLLFNILVALLIGAVASQVFAADPFLVAGIVFFGATAIRLGGAIYLKLNGKPMTFQRFAFMAVQTEVWETEIAENLFKDYSWIKRARDRSGNVLENKVVHIPQAGAKPNASKNREVYPLPVVKRNDLDITYPIDEISTDATYIPDAEKIELSYPKLASTVKDHFGVLGEASAKDILDRWYPATKIVRSSGADTAVYLTGQTGTRKKYMVADIGNAKTQLNLDTKKEGGNRGLIMSENAYNQIKSDPIVQDIDTRDSVGAVWKDGELVRLHGADIIRTDVTGRYDNSGTPVKKDYTAANAATDNDVILFVDFDKVHYALGTIKFFENKDDATYQGDVYSAKVRFGGRKERNDEVGVVAIVQQP